MKLDSSQIVFIVADNLLDSPGYQRVEIVAIQGEALSNTFIVGRKFGTETIQCDLIVIVKILKHTHDLPDGSDVKVLFIVLVMQRLGCFIIGVSEVNPQNEMKARPIDDICKKGISIHLAPSIYYDITNYESVFVDSLTNRSSYLLLLA